MFICTAQCSYVNKMLFSTITSTTVLIPNTTVRRIEKADTLLCLVYFEPGHIPSLTFPEIPTAYNSISRIIQKSVVPYHGYRKHPN